MSDPEKKPIRKGEAVSYATITAAISAVLTFMSKNFVNDSSTEDLFDYLIPVISAMLAATLLKIMKIFEIDPDKARARRLLKSKIKHLKRCQKRASSKKRFSELDRQIQEAEDSMADLFTN